jgi:hypothetical protein
MRPGTSTFNTCRGGWKNIRFDDRVVTESVRRAVCARDGVAVENGFAAAEGETRRALSLLVVDDRAGLDGYCVSFGVRIEFIPLPLGGVVSNVISDALVFRGIADDVVVETRMPPEARFCFSCLVGYGGFVAADDR